MATVPARKGPMQRQRISENILVITVAPARKSLS